MEALQEVIINSAISIITVLVGVAVTALKQWQNAKRAEIETKQSVEQLHIIDSVTYTTVNYIEQVYKDVKGSEKIMRALTSAQKELQEQGVNISDEQLRVFIESAVKQANESWKAA